MTLLAKAYDDLKGDLSNCHDFNAKNDRFLYLYQGGNYCTFDFKNTGSLLTYISTVEDFINFKGDNIKAVIDWSKAPEGATHCWANMDSFYKFSRHDTGFVWQNCEWQQCSDIGCFEGELTEKPQPTPTFTQAMADNGVLPSVGMECVVSFVINGNNKQVGKLLFISDEYVIIKDESCEQHYFRSDVNLLPAPPVTLTDGDCYSYNYFGPKKGFYNKAKNRLISLHGSSSPVAVTNIQPLTVEVK